MDDNDWAPYLLPDDAKSYTLDRNGQVVAQQQQQQQHACFSDQCGSVWQPRPPQQSLFYERPTEVDGATFQLMVAEQKARTDARTAHANGLFSYWTALDAQMVDLQGRLRSLEKLQSKCLDEMVRARLIRVDDVRNL